MFHSFVFKKDKWCVYNMFHDTITEYDTETEARQWCKWINKWLAELKGINKR